MSDDTRRIADPSGSDESGPDRSNEPGVWFELEIATGERLGDRYVVERFLGQGAMGIVFAVRDSELDTTVAAKVLRPLLARSTDAQGRFRREVTTARRITHPNVCRIYDLGYHHDRRSGLDLPFFTMELLEGPTLAAWIDERGPLEAADALDLLRGIIAGLSAAHAAGVVHRDFKSSNVVIVADGAERRPVVSDFGLSRNLRAGSGSPITAHGQVLGTPAFIAPEQLRSQPVTPAADIYALGVLMYQMMTGRLPFESRNPVTTAMMRLQRDPDPPSSLIPDLDPAWERTILRCLRREPGERPKRVEAILPLIDPALRTSALGDLESEDLVAADAGSPTFTRPRRNLAAALLLVILAFVGSWWNARQPSPQVEPPPAAEESRSPARTTVAVAALDSLQAPEELHWIGHAVAEMLTTEVGAEGALRALSRNTVARYEEAPDPTPLLSRLPTTYLIEGTYFVEGNQAEQTLRLDLRLLSATDDATVASWSQTGRTDQIVQLVQMLGSELREALGASPLTTEEGDRLARTQPGNRRVAELLTAARVALRARDGNTARQALQEAVDLEPDNAILYSELGRAWRLQGYDAQAREVAIRAAELAADIPREAQLLIQAQQQSYQGDWVGAAETYDALAHFHPDELRFARLRTEAWVGAGLAARADASLSSLTEDFDTTSDPEIALLEAEVAALRSDVPRIGRAAAQAWHTARQQGALHLEAEARLKAANAARRSGDLDQAEQHLLRARSLYELTEDRHGLGQLLVERARLEAAKGNPSEALAQIAEARSLFEEVGAQRGRIRATLVSASLARRQGHASQARRDYETARALSQQVGFPEGEHDALKGLAILDSIEGDLAAAERHFDEALTAARASGNLGDEAAALNNLAIVLSDRGESSRAESYYRLALDQFERIGHLDGLGSALNNLAILQWDRGELGEAAASFERCLEVYRDLEDESSIALVLANHAEVLRDRGDLTTAAEALAEAAAIQARLGEPMAAAKSEALLAFVQLDLGEVDTAAQTAREALSALRGASVPDDEAIARLALALAHQALGEAAAARRELDLASSLADRRDSPAIALAVAIATLSLEPNPTTALRRAEQLIDECRRTGVVRLELEARWAHAQALARTDPEAGLQELERLARDAAALGFHRLAALSSTTTKQPSPIQSLSG